MMGNLSIAEIIIIICVIVLFGKWLVDYYYEIKKRNRYMEAQIRLLMHLASIQGVDQDKIASIVAEAKLPISKI
jgi:hypothetical protein